LIASASSGDKHFRISKGVLTLSCSITHLQRKFALSVVPTFAIPSPRQTASEVQ
jgi:hypothetical protein